MVKIENVPMTHIYKRNFYTKPHSDGKEYTQYGFNWRIHREVVGGVISYSAKEMHQKMYISYFLFRCSSRLLLRRRVVESLPLDFGLQQKKEIDSSKYKVTPFLCKVTM